MHKHLTFSLILASTMALTTAAFAASPDEHQGGADGHHGQRHGHGDRMGLAKLNLTESQRASVKTIVGNSRAQNKGQFDALRQQRDAFHSMTPDQVGYQAAAARLAQTEGSATQARVQQKANVAAQIYAVLTPAQKAQMATMRTQRQARREQWKSFKAAHPAPAVNSTTVN
jgi:protein CpxP